MTLSAYFKLTHKSPLHLHLHLTNTSWHPCVTWFMVLQQETPLESGNTEALRRPEASTPEWRQMVPALTLWCSTMSPQSRSSGLHLFLLIMVFVPCLTSGKLVEEVSGSGVPPASPWRGGESFNFLTPPRASATLNDHSSKVGPEERKDLSRNTFFLFACFQLGFISTSSQLVHKSSVMSPVMWPKPHDMAQTQSRIMMWLAAGYQGCLWPDTWQQEGDAGNTRSSVSLCIKGFWDLIQKFDAWTTLKHKPNQTKGHVTFPNSWDCVKWSDFSICPTSVTISHLCLPSYFLFQLFFVLSKYYSDSVLPIVSWDFLCFM